VINYFSLIFVKKWSFLRFLKFFLRYTIRFLRFFLRYTIRLAEMYLITSSLLSAQVVGEEVVFVVKHFHAVANVAVVGGPTEGAAQLYGHQGLVAVSGEPFPSLCLNPVVLHHLRPYFGLE
jgi:hypothetical protein